MLKTSLATFKTSLGGSASFAKERFLASWPIKRKPPEERVSAEPRPRLVLPLGRTAKVLAFFMVAFTGVALLDEEVGITSMSIWWLIIVLLGSIAVSAARIAESLTDEEQPEPPLDI